MRISVSEFISLDGVVQAPGGAEEDTEGGFTHGGWSMPFFDPDVMGSSIGEITGQADALLYGRRTWQVMAGAWPGRAGDPFADWINSVEKHVVSEHPDRSRPHVGGRPRSSEAPMPAERREMPGQTPSVVELRP